MSLELRVVGPLLSDVSSSSSPTSPLPLLFPHLYFSLPSPVLFLFLPSLPLPFFLASDPGLLSIIAQWHLLPFLSRDRILLYILGWPQTFNPPPLGPVGLELQSCTATSSSGPSTFKWKTFFHLASQNCFPRGHNFSTWLHMASTQPFTISLCLSSPDPLHAPSLLCWAQGQTSGLARCCHGNLSKAPRCRSSL